MITREELEYPLLDRCPYCERRFCQFEFETKPGMNAKQVVFILMGFASGVMVATGFAMVLQ